MDQKLGPSRLGDVLQPFLLAGVFLATASAAGLALSYDPSRASATVQIAFLVLLVASIALISPYMLGIVAQAFGNLSISLLGVRAAAAGCAGFAAMIGLAMARPLEPLAGVAWVAAGLGLIALQVGLRRRSRRVS
jgi:hypothetical protein